MRVIVSLKSGLGALVIAGSLAGVAQAASLQVVVGNVRDARGHVRIGVCTRQEFLGDRCVHHAVVAAHPGPVTATIDDIPPGVYAVAVYQDVDDSGHLKRGFFGMPQEDVGFSRDPSLGLGPPGFDASALRIGDVGGRIVVTMHHFGS